MNSLHADGIIGHVGPPTSDTPKPKNLSFLGAGRTRNGGMSVITSTTKDRGGCSSITFTREGCG
jgi:hypothetical protein